MQNDLENKQMYLRSEILDKGYNGQEFFDFLIQKKGEEAGDLTNWTTEDLKKIVIEFHKLHKQNITEENNINSNPQQELIIQNQNESENKYNDNNNTIQPKTINNNNEINEKNKKENKNKLYEIQCKIDDNGKLSKYDVLIIKLSSPEKKVESSGLLGLFSKTISITYNITTEPINKSVRRRYTDFEWLRKVFTKLYPSIFIPPIPLKTLQENANEHKIEKRMRFLERFLNNVVKEPLLKNSNILYEFLCDEKQNEFESFQKKYEKYNFPVLLENMQTRTGKIIIDKNILKEPKIFSEIRENFNQNQFLLSNIISSYKSLFKEMKQVSNRMLEISEIYKKIYELSVKNGENTNLCKSYHSMEQIMNNWGYLELNSATNINLEIREYFKFVKLEYNSIKELYDKYDYQRNLYYNSKEKLLNRKEKLFKENDITQWDLPNEENIDVKDKDKVFSKMLPNETSQVHSIKLCLFYYATSLKNEFERLKEIIGFQNIEKFKQFYTKNSKLMEELNKTLMIFKGI